MAAVWLLEFAGDVAFFFQAEDGIRDYDVTGVQTCALPIFRWKLTRDEPVITEGAFDSQNLAFWDAHTLQYREYHRTFVNGVRAIMTGTASDFINWTKPVLLKYQGGIPAQHLYTNAVQPYGRAPHLRSEEHTSELQSRRNLVCRLLLEKKKTNKEHKPDPGFCQV